MVWLGSTYFDFSISKRNRSGSRSFSICNFDLFNIAAIVCCAAAAAAARATQKAASSNCNSESDSRKSH
jgi:hypothetical protein